MPLGPPSGYPPPPSTPPRRRGATWVLVVLLAVVLFAASVGAGLVLADRRDGEDEASGEAVLGDDEVDALVEELSAFVEEERGLRFVDEVDVEVLDGEAYRERLIADAEEHEDEDLEDLEQTAAALTAIGLWPEGADVVEISRQFVAVASLGVYDAEEDEMLVLGEADTPNLRLTLVHELTHALDDQHFDLTRLERLSEELDESGSAFSALVEGNASRVESAYEATLSDDEREAIREEQLDLIEDVDLSGIPPVMFALQEWKYVGGEAFVDELVDQGGNDAVDDALEEPPTTSEQILEPDVWPERDPIVDVDQPEAEGEPVELGSLGQAFLGVLVHGPLGAGQDVPEWDGDNSVGWEAGDEFCVRFALAGDVDGYDEALSTWAGRVDAEVEVVDDLLVAESCG